MTDSGPWGSPDQSAEPDPRERPSEPAFNTDLGKSWALILTVALIGVAFAVQLYLRYVLQQPGLETLGALSRGTLAEGWWWTPLSSMFMHAGILHLAMNMSALLPFGLILSRRFGPGLRGQGGWLAFYLLAGLAGDAVYLALQSDPLALVVGASGAIFGLWGGVARLSRQGELLPLFSREVGRQLGGPIIANVVVVLAFGLSGAGGIAWQAHVGGFLFGLLAIGFFLPRRQDAEA